MSFLAGMRIVSQYLLSLFACLTFRTALEFTKTRFRGHSGRSVRALAVSPSQAILASGAVL